MNDETKPILDPVADRVTWDAPIHSVADIQARSPGRRRWSTSSRRASARSGRCSPPTTTATRTGSARTAAASGSSVPGRGHIQYLASLFHPDTPNDVAPSGYNTAGTEPGLPSSPLEPMPTATGFRWGE